MEHSHHINNIIEYLQTFTSQKPKWAQPLVEYAKEHRVPIIDELSIQVLLQLLHIYEPKQILEIGTAIGYSALRMHEIVPYTKIVTIEKNERMYKLAMKNIKQYRSLDQIELIHGDALEQLKRLRSQSEAFDFVFIDAAKSQYKNFFKLINPMVPSGGIIISDNVLFRGFVGARVEEVPKRFKTIVNNLIEYNQYVMKHEQYYSSILPIGDGLLISVKL